MLMGSGNVQGARGVDVEKRGVGRDGLGSRGSVAGRRERGRWCERLRLLYEDEETFLVKRRRCWCRSLVFDWKRRMLGRIYR